MRIIKKYPNRRLYDTERSVYITLNEVHQIVRSGEDFKALRESYERSGLIFVLRDRLLADKAMDRIYAKAKVTEVEPREPRTGDGDAETPAEAPAESKEETK